MQGVLFGLFKDMATAEQARNALLAMGIPPEDATLHHQDVPVGNREEHQGKPRPPDEKGLFAGLFDSLFNSGGEMDDSKHVDTVRQALHRGEYAVSVSVDSADQMSRAEDVFTRAGAVLQLHPDA